MQLKSLQQKDEADCDQTDKEMVKEQIMIGRTIKSGARLKAEQAVIEGTNDEGFLPKDRVDHLLNKEVLRNVLVRLGYSAEYRGSNVQKGWICSRH